MVLGVVLTSIEQAEHIVEISCSVVPFGNSAKVRNRQPKDSLRLKQVSPVSERGYHHVPVSVFYAVATIDQVKAFPVKWQCCHVGVNIGLDAGEDIDVGKSGEIVLACADVEFI